MNPTPDEQQKAASAVLNQLRKKNLSGMLAAQRNGTLDEFLAPHLAEYWAKQAEKKGHERPASARVPAGAHLNAAAPTQRPVTMGRPVPSISPAVATPAVAASAAADPNPRGIQIVRVLSEEVRAETISAVKKDGLNSTCAYVVTDPAEKEVYQWVGKSCTPADSAFADALALDMASSDLRSTRPVLKLQQLAGTVALENMEGLTEIIFWQIITGVNPPSVSAELKQKCSLATPPRSSPLVALEYNTGAGGQFVPIGDALAAGGNLLTRDILKSTRVVAIECGANCYLWIGPEVAASAVSSSIDVLRRRISNSPGRVLCQVRNASEPSVFKRLFAVSMPTAPETKPAAKTEKLDLMPKATPVEDSKEERPVSVSERTKRFSKTSGSHAATQPAVNSTANAAAAAASAPTAQSDEVDTSTMSVKERMAFFKSKSSNQQSAPKKEPVDVGANVGLKEKKLIMEETLNPKNIHLNMTDGTGGGRRSSFTVDDVPDLNKSNPPSVSGKPKADIGTSEEIHDGKDLAIQVAPMVSPIGAAALTEDVNVAEDAAQDPNEEGDNTLVVGSDSAVSAPHTTHKKHVPKFKTSEVAPIVTPIAAAALTEHVNVAEDATQDTNEEGDNTLVVGNDSAVSAPHTTHEKHIPEFKTSEVAPAVTPSAAAALTEDVAVVAKQDAKNNNYVVDTQIAESATSHNDGPATDALMRDSAGTPVKNPVNNVVCSPMKMENEHPTSNKDTIRNNAGSVQQKDPEITSPYQKMTDDNVVEAGKKSSSLPPANKSDEGDDSCCIIM